MGIAINREIVGDLNNPSNELLAYCIEQHRQTVERLNKLSDYYDGKQDILKRTKENVESPNNKVLINHAKYVVDMNVGFMVGNPISYAPELEKNIKPILDAYDRVDIVSHDTEMEKDLSVFGVAYELIYLSGDDPEIDVKCIDPRGIFLVTDDTIDKNKLFGVHYQEVKNLQGAVSHYILKYYNDNRVITYKSAGEAMTDFLIVDAKPHYFGAVPINEYRNNEEKQGDFEQAISLIDAYNLLQSDRLNDKEAFVDAIMFIQGFMLEDGAGAALLKERMLQAPGSPAETAASYLTKELDEDGVNLLRSAILQDIHKITYVPDMNDEKFSGNVSGEAMKYKLFGLLQLMSVKSRYMIKGLRQRLQTFENFLSIKDSTIDAEGTKISLKPNLPINTSDIINQIVQAYQAGILPLKTLLAWLPDVDDVDEVLRQLKLEKEEAIELNQKAIGIQSHDDTEEVDVIDEEA